MEKTVSLTHEEATALLEMSLCTTLPDAGDAANSALGKIADLCRQFALEDPQRELIACESKA